MKILITHPLHPKIVSSGLGELISYRPELSTAVESERLRVVQEERPAMVVSGSDRPRAAGADDGFRADLEALGTAERRLMAADTAEALSAYGIGPGGGSGVAGRRVLLVGAGIVNLITADSLIRQGAEVEILDAGPDPRTRPPWQELGATHGGADARMFCYTEADNYNEKANRVYAHMREVFRRRITEGGWLVTPYDELTGRERQWIDDFLELPRWRAEVFTEDIHRFNITSGSLWDHMKRDAAELFTDVGFTPGVLRVYAQAEKVDAACALQRRLDPAELKRRHPGFAAAVDRGEIAGGLEIEGFTLGLHRFVRNLLDRLERQGASFLWRRQVLGLERGPDGAVSGLRTADGVQRSDHYVLSPGASCRDLLAGTASDAAIQGILGLWHFLPHVEPRLGRSVKIHREGHVGEDSNITVGRDPSGRPTLILGSGYGFLGERELDMASPEIQCLFDALEVTARRYLPDAYARAVKEGTLYGDRKACVRPFTSTGLGLFEVLPTAEGGRLVITGGHNTGGFTQAPAVAEAVAETLGGGTHAMQSLFRPDRGRTAADPAGQALASPPPEVESATALSAVGSG